MIGTGASAIQIVPAIQPDVERLTLFQRTPAWVLPRADRKISAAEKWLHAKVPATRAARRGLLWGLRELQVSAFTKRPNELGLIEFLGRRPYEAGRQGPGSCAPSSPPTTASAASASCSPTPTTRRWPSPMWTSSRPG